MTGPRPPDRTVTVFLRGINLGSRRVTGQDLMRSFRDAGFGDVQSFLASGNVVVRDPGMPVGEIEAVAEDAVARSFGFQADAFARTLDHLAAVLSDPVVSAAEGDGFTPHMLFLKEEPTPESRERVEGLVTEEDGFPILGREMLWLRRGRLSDSAVSFRDLERALGHAPNTMRKVTTIRRLVAKFG